MAKRRRPTSSRVAGLAVFLFMVAWISLKAHNPPSIKSLKMKPRNLDRFHGCSMDCPFVHTGQTHDAADIVMVDFSGYSRTGNYINAMRFAIDLAAACKKTIALPVTDDENQAFKIDGKFSRLDFSNRNGSESAVCNKISFPIKGNGGTFWSLLLKTNLSEGTGPDYLETVSSLTPFVHMCVMKYLGVCGEDYCRFPGDHTIKGDNTLVVHLREGDIFPPGYESTKIHSPNYGQPPLSYYLQAINFKPWTDIVIVTQPGNVGPIHAALRVINGTRIGEFRLQMSSWYDDLRTCMCAQNLVTSFSTLTETVFPYGFSKRMFSYECQRDPLELKEYYKIAVENYPPFDLHNNSAEEWVQTITHQVSGLQTCPL